jgi:hypothetical protein
MTCHPERSEGSAVRRKMQIPRFARDDKIWRIGVLRAWSHFRHGLLAAKLPPEIQAGQP